MKKTFITVVLLSMSLLAVFASPVKEQKEVSIAVMQGPTGFSSAGLGDWVNVEIYPSPVEAVSNLINGSIDFAVIPANKAALLYLKGMDIKVLAITGEGMLSIVGTDNHGQVLSVPGIGDTPDFLSSFLFPEYEKDYSISSPAQLAQLMIAGKTDFAILPQPFVNKVISSNENVHIIHDVSSKWTEKTGELQYPMSVLVSTASFIKANPSTVENLLKDYEKSVDWVLSNKRKAGEKIESLGIMAKDLAILSIDDCNLVFKKGVSAKQELEAYFKTALDSAVDDSFYFL